MKLQRTLRRRAIQRNDFGLAQSDDDERTRSTYEMLIIGVSVLIASVLGLVLLIASALLVLSFAEFLNWPPKPTLSTMLVVICLSLAIFLSSVWYLASAGLVYFDQDAKRMVGRVLIASLLGAVTVGAAVTFKDTNGVSSNIPTSNNK